MTDDRIAELLGWPKIRAHLDSSLMHRIRLVVAEAQAEASTEIEHQQETIIEQGRKLREIVNLIRGEPPEGSAHSTHDAVELVRGLSMHADLYASAAANEIAALKRVAAEQFTQIERMRAALTAARNVVAVDRESFVQCVAGPDPLDIDDQGIVDEYDALLRMIDEAMGEQA